MLDEAVARRNFLAHRFWFERCHLMFSEEGTRQLIDDLRADSEFFSRVDGEIGAHFADQLARLGLTDECRQLALEEMLQRGEEWQAPATQRRLRKQETIVRAWDAPAPDSQATLIFELEDGSLWQLSDIGLTWTRFSSTAPDWGENPRIKPYLPAQTNPRPGTAGSWDYELALGADARLVVGLNKKRPKAFVWRLRIGRDRGGA